jgi:hypothetical protein
VLGQPNRPLETASMVVSKVVGPLIPADYRPIWDATGHLWASANWTERERCDCRKASTSSRYAATEAGRLPVQLLLQGFGCIHRNMLFSGSARIISRADLPATAASRSNASAET